MLDLSGTKIIGHTEAGAVTVLGAQLGGSLNCRGASLCNDAGPALSGDGLQVGLSVLLSGGFTATGVGAAGAVHLVTAHIGGQLDCTGATLRNTSGPALNAHSLHVGRGMYLRKGFTATGTGEEGAVDLTVAQVGGGLSCAGATLRNDSGPGLRAYRLRVSENIAFTEGFTAVGSGVIVNTCGSRSFRRLQEPPHPRLGIGR